MLLTGEKIFMPMNYYETIVIASKFVILATSAQDDADEHDEYEALTRKISLDFKSRDIFIEFSGNFVTRFIVISVFSHLRILMF